MKNRLLAFSCLCVLVLNLAASAVDGKAAKAPSQAGQLAAMLPAVDGAVAIDAKRLFSSLPRLLSANPTFLGKITGGMDEMKADTGVDIRQFDYLAVGFAAKKTGAKGIDGDPIVIARGQVSAAALIGAAKIAANGRYREEKVGDKTIYLFSPKAVVDQAKKQMPAGTDPAAVDKVASKINKEIAVTVLDPGTIAFGDLALVRQTIGSQKTAVSTEITQLLAKNETSVVNFAGRMPGGMGALLPLDNDELGKNIDSIRFVYGGLDLAGDAATLNVTARTLQSSQAAALLETLEGLQLIGKAFLGGAKGPDKQVYARLIESAKFSTSGNEVLLNLQVPQSDIDILVAGLK
jgi:hypothetical protein